MKLVDLLHQLSAYPLDMEVLVYDTIEKKSVEPSIALRTTKATVALQPPALIIYPPKV